MKFLFPHRYKMIGVVVAPLGLSLWLISQLGFDKLLLTHILGHSDTAFIQSVTRGITLIAKILGFFSFLAGLYCIAFSKEEVEDEMVQKIRLDSFQFAAFLQLVATIAGFLFVLISGDPGESGMMLFFIALLFLFWLAFIGRFNYILHLKYRQ